MFPLSYYILSYLPFFCILFKFNSFFLPLPPLHCRSAAANGPGGAGSAGYGAAAAPRELAGGPPLSQARAPLHPVIYEDLPAVLLDLEHVFFRMEKALSSPRDPLVPLFTSLMVNAFYITDADDLAKVKAYLRDRGYTNAQIAAMPQRYFRKHVRRTVPIDPRRTLARVLAVFDYFQGMETLEGKPFFNSKKDDILANLVGHITRGCIRDPHDVSVFTEVQVPGGLSIMLCGRGSVQNECVHSNLPDALKSYNSAPALANGELSKFVAHYNADVQCRSSGRSLPLSYDFELVDTAERLTHHVWGRGGPFEFSHVVTPLVTRAEIQANAVGFGCCPLLPAISPGVSSGVEAAHGLPGPSSGEGTGAAGTGAAGADSVEASPSATLPSSAQPLPSAEDGEDGDGVGMEGNEALHELASLALERLVEESKQQLQPHPPCHASTSRAPSSTFLSGGSGSLGVSPINNLAQIAVYNTIFPQCVQAATGAVDYVRFQNKYNDEVVRLHMEAVSKGEPCRLKRTLMQ